MKFIVLLLTAYLIVGCNVSLIDQSDPLGMTSRAQIRANAEMQKAREDRLAREAEAQAKVDEEEARQSGMNNRTATVMLIVPIIFIILGITGAFWMMIHWRGRIHLETVRQLRDPSQYPLISTTQTPYQKLRDYARSSNNKLLFVQGKPAQKLPDGRIIMISAYEQKLLGVNYDD